MVTPVTDSRRWYRPGKIRAVTFDFFETLVRHRAGHGRGRSLSEYLLTCGYMSPPQWSDELLYRVFEIHAADYSPGLSGPERRSYLRRLASRVFHELGMVSTTDESDRHALALWEILGPSAFDTYADVESTLQYLKGKGVALAVISNWHCGLAHFVSDLGLMPYFDHVVGSADYGFAKPDRRIFAKASNLLGVEPSQILHVGDSYEADYMGGRDAGFQVALLDRTIATNVAGRVVRSLADVRALVE